MFNIDFEDRRFKSSIRTLQYAFLTILVLAGASILVLTGLGYDFNRQSGVIRNGLLLVNSIPDNAQVILNGRAETDNTPSRFALPAGAYDMRIEAAGYRPWIKNVEIIGSEVEWVYYPLLIPQELATHEIASFRSLEFAERSPDGRFVLTRQQTTRPAFNLMTVNNEAVTNEKNIVLPETLIEITPANRVGRFQFEGWAGNNRHALIRHSSGSRVEFIWLDTEDVDESRNLTDEFQLPLRETRFINGGQNRVYSLVDGALRRLDLEADTISAPLVRQVSSYIAHSDRFVAYIAQDDDGAFVGLIEGDQPPRVLARLDGKVERYKIDFAEFDGNFYLALLDTVAESVRLFKDPHTAGSGIVIGDPAYEFELAGVNQLSFSPNGQYLIGQAGSSLASYDLDRERQYKYSVKGQVSMAEWMDGYRLLSTDKSGRLIMFEFDGGNQHTLVETNPGYAPWFDTDFEHLYFISPTSANSQFLTSLSLVAENQDAN